MINNVQKTIELLTIGIENPIIEIRMLKTSKGTISGYYDKSGFLKIGNDIKKYNGNNNIYITLNPIRAELLARGVNKLREYTKDSTKDDHMTHRNWLLVDFDAIRVSDISSTDEEKMYSKVLCDIVYNELSRLGFTEPIKADSGNGYHLLYRIDMLNDVESKKMIETFLKILSGKFDSEYVSIDKSVFNAARITKLYGTMAVKGDSTLERPHRLSYIIHAPDSIQILQKETIQKYIDSNLNKIEKPKTTKKVTKNKKEFNIEEWMQSHGIQVSHIKNESNKISYVLESCPFNNDHKSPDSAIFKYDDGLGFKCLHNSCSDKKWKDIRELFEPGCYDSKFNLNSLVSRNKHFTNPLDNKDRYTMDDIGNGFLFADTYKHCSRYVIEQKEWAFYNGKTWKLDVGDLNISQQAKKLVKDLFIHALAIVDDDIRAKTIKFFNGLNVRHNRETMVKDAKDVFPISILDFDNCKTLFNCQNGVLDLKTFEFKKHSPEFLLSKISNVIYDPDAKCERWDKFVNEIMLDDEEKSEFLQKSLGYLLSGETDLECFFILYGHTTRNGKGTTMNTMLHMLGDYGCAANPETLTQKNNARGNESSEDIARLKGARFVSISEPEKGLKLNTALIKQLTGSDPVTSRFLHKNSFTYKPEYKIFISTNFLPWVSDNSIFTSNRIKLIPFDRHFELHEQDTNLKDFFIRPENLSGILNWCIKGLKMLRSEGLKSPESINIATKSYQEDNDVLQSFINDTLVPCDGERIAVKSIYNIYKKWTLDNGHKTSSSHTLGKELRLKLKAKDTNTGWMILNHKLRDKTEQKWYENIQ